MNPVLTRASIYCLFMLNGVKETEGASSMLSEITAVCARWGWFLNAQNKSTQAITEVIVVSSLKETVTIQGCTSGLFFVSQQLRSYQRETELE